jgi:hypothetical protein
MGNGRAWSGEYLQPPQLGQTYLMDAALVLRCCQKGKGYPCQHHMSTQSLKHPSTCRRIGQRGQDQLWSKQRLKTWYGTQWGGDFARWQGHTLYLCSPTLTADARAPSPCPSLLAPFQNIKKGRTDLKRSHITLGGIVKVPNQC